MITFCLWYFSRHSDNNAMALANIVLPASIANMDWYIFLSSSVRLSFSRIYLCLSYSFLISKARFSYAISYVGCFADFRDRNITGYCPICLVYSTPASIIFFPWKYTELSAAVPSGSISFSKKVLNMLWANVFPKRLGRVNNVTIFFCASKSRIRSVLSI